MVQCCAETREGRQRHTGRPCDMVQKGSTLGLGNVQPGNPGGNPRCPHVCVTVFADGVSVKPTPQVAHIKRSLKNTPFWQKRVVDGGQKRRWLRIAYFLTQ